MMKMKRKSLFKTLTPKSTWTHASANSIESSEDVSTTRRNSAYSRILQLSIEQYARGYELLERNDLDSAKECFEDALAARLVVHGPDSEEVMETHHQLRLIARNQGDLRKAAHHKARIMQIQSTKFRQKCKRVAADRIDWRVLSED
jgi:hypothetical protein